MALQDLTPQLRTRLNRMEKAVGWFVLLATALLLLGFGYYVYTAAEHKGWFKVKAPYFTYVDSAKGLSVGDPVLLMGFKAGTVTEVQPQPPGDAHNVCIHFEIIEPYFGYLWSEGTKAEATSDLLGRRALEVSKGTGGCGTYLTHPFRENLALSEARTFSKLDDWHLAEDIQGDAGTNGKPQFAVKSPLSKTMLDELGKRGITKIRAFDKQHKNKAITAVWNEDKRAFDTFVSTNSYYLPPDEAPTLNDRADALLTKIEKALPDFLRLTNEITGVLSNGTGLTISLKAVAESVRPAITNLTFITANLRNPEGSLGEWLIPTNVHQQLEATLTHVNLTMTNANTNLAVLAESLTKSLDNLASITSNLNNQVEVNTNILTRISDIVVHSDELIQGLKKHWLLRSAFKTPKTNAPPARASSPMPPSLSPKERQQRGEK